MSITNTNKLPGFSLAEAAQAVKKHWGISGNLKQLEGERDLNFKITDESGKQFVFKIANGDEHPDMLLCQHEVLNRLKQHELDLIIPEAQKTLSGPQIVSLKSSDRETHAARLVEYIPGKLLSQIKPHRPELLQSLGAQMGAIDKALQGFQHTALERPLLWNMRESVQTVNRFKPLIGDSNRLALVNKFIALYEKTVTPVCSELRQGVIHNDANDNNVIVGGDDAWSQRVTAVIDFGDMVTSYICSEAAVAAAYAMLAKDDPLAAAASVVRGYHQTHPLTETEISALFSMMCMRLCLSVTVCAYQQSVEPDNEYLRVSEKSAWETLERLSEVNADWAYFIFRDACGLVPNQNCDDLVTWLKENAGTFASIVDVDFKNDKLLQLDNSVSSPFLGDVSKPVDAEQTTREIAAALKRTPSKAGIGLYGEYRLIYEGGQFVTRAGERRTLHLGIDVFMPADTPVYAPLAGKIYGFANNADYQDYGGTIVLEHRVQDNEREILFYTLYGHLSLKSLEGLRPGQSVAKGERVGWMGGINENGGWAPHTHFQIMTNMLGQTSQFAGVGTHGNKNVWMSLCPDPNLILNLPQETVHADNLVTESIQSLRDTHVGPSLSISYRKPLHIVRGAMQYLYDYTGRQYLDAVNNVPHVGHCHPAVVEAVNLQNRVLNTNTRYLHQNIVRYGKRLTEKLPAPLEVCYLVCSGSEANDLALRLARTFTGRKNILVLDHAYHGHTQSLIDASPYKHDGHGGQGTPAHIHKVVMPDTYRGFYKNDDNKAGEKYATHVQEALKQAQASGGAGAFMHESILGCGGQVELPENYLTHAYQHAREHGAVCIADEVQVGFGRVGSHFWAFETQNVVPDIVTLGKPIGNGHPLAAVITTREIADAFNNGMEYFNTFGGNPVSCAAGLAVLDVIENENLQNNALEVGEVMLAGSEKLKQQFPIIGDVRGRGLFIGVELVNNRETLEPAAKQASYIAERMKEEGVLISTDGPLHNVLKIKPPMCFTQDNAKILVLKLKDILKEDFAQPTL